MQINNPIIEHGIFFKRILLASIIIIVLVIILLTRIFNLQILQYNYYSQESLDNLLLFQPIAPTRGKIFDRNGVLLADNKLSYQLTITPEKTPNVAQILQQLKNEKIITSKHIKKYWKRRPYYRKFQDIPLANDMSEKKITKILVSQNYIGLDIKAYFKRIYPTQEIMSHIIGYVGRINRKGDKKIGYIGKTGIEKQYESILHGTSGSQSVIRNASGKSIDTTIIKSAQPGHDLHLSIDFKLQKKALELLGNNRGSIVMMSVQTGEILTLASAPSFDTNPFVNGISFKDFQKLQNNKDRPLFNRAISGIYPPGSTLKPFIALAGIESDTINENYQLFCRGWYNLPNHSHQYRDWKKSGHGQMNLQDSIAQSCDVFFYDIANQMGIETMYEHLTKFNFGRKTHIDLPNESSGVLPSKAWKRQVKRQSWYKGETIIVGIGQGFINTTPLQLVVSTAALANRGKLVRPKLLKDTQTPKGELQHNPTVFSKLSIKNINHYEIVINGMKRTIYSKKGTARRLNKNLNYTLAGKTGTAQVFGLARDESYIEQNIAKHLRDHALFTAFAPADTPEIAISVVVENAGSGSAHAAPLAKKMLDAYFQNASNNTNKVK